jgi:hypothetical protein
MAEQYALVPVTLPGAQSMQSVHYLAFLTGICVRAQMYITHIYMGKELILDLTSSQTERIGTRVWEANTEHAFVQASEVGRKVGSDESNKGLGGKH